MKLYKLRAYNHNFTVGNYREYPQVIFLKDLLILINRSAKIAKNPTNLTTGNCLSQMNIRQVVSNRVKGKPLYSQTNLDAFRIKNCQRCQKDGKSVK